MAGENDVHEASKKFYAALNHMAKGDASLMSDIWSHGGTVTTMHPIGGREGGWGEVRKSFEEVAKLCSAGHVELRDQVVHVGGDMAYELGVEHGQVTLQGACNDRLLDHERFRSHGTDGLLAGHEPADPFG